MREGANCNEYFEGLNKNVRNIYIHTHLFLELRLQIFNFNNIQEYSKYAKYSVLLTLALQTYAVNGMDNNNCF